MLLQTYYDQIVTNSREDQLINFTTPFLRSDKFVSDYETKRSKKKEEAIQELTDRIQQYKYKI